MTLEKFIPTIWAGRILRNYHSRVVYASLCNRDWEGEIKDKGDSVKITSIGPVTVAAYVKNVDLAAPELIDDAQLQLRITEQDSFHFSVDDIDKTQQTPKMFGDATREAGQAMRLSADTFVSGLMEADVPAANQIGSFTVGELDVSMYAVLTRLNRILDENEVPEEGRWAVVPAFGFEELQLDERFSSFGTEGNTKRLMNGLGGEIKATGMMIHKSNRTPTSGTGRVVIAGHRDATTFADQINKTEAYRPQRSFSDAVKGLHTYGARVIRPYALASAIIEQSSAL